MKKYIIIDSITGIVNSIVQWSDVSVSITVIENEEEKEVIELKEVEFPDNWIFKKNEVVITCEDNCNVFLGDVYYPPTNEFYVLDVSDTETEIADLKYQLSELELVLSEFQEATWTALNIDETKLPEVWQERLNKKRIIRQRLNELIQN